VASLADAMLIGGVGFWVAKISKVLITLRALALLVTVLAIDASEHSASLALAIVLAAAIGVVPLVSWGRVERAVLRHPLWLAGEVLLAGTILAATSPDGPFFVFTLGTAVLAGLLFSWLGVGVFGALLVAAYELALTIWLRDHEGGATLRLTIGLPSLYVVAAVAGAAARRVIDTGAQAEAALHELEREREREAERARLARDLHDSLAKSVEGLGLIAASLPARIERDPAGAARLATELAADARATAGEARELMCELRAGGDVRLVAALEQEVAAARARAGLGGATTVCPDLDLPPSVCREILLIAREALRNVERHAQASRVDVRLAVDAAAHRLELEIADDGCGLRVPAGSPELRDGGHFGLIGMSERAALAGGSLTVGPAPGASGTVVRAQLPLAGVTA
jgi:signal transduction histidine kinase